MAGCAKEGGCPSDYVAIALSVLSTILLLVRFTYPFVVHKVPRTNVSGFWLLVIQAVASISFLFSLVMSFNYLNLKERSSWQSCYVWAVWFEAPLGFGLLMCCRIIQAFQLYHLFVKRHLPPVKPYVLLLCIMCPWIGTAAFIQLKKPLNHLCHLKNIRWSIPVASLHAVYIAALVCIMWAVRHIEFRFHEFKDLLLGVLISVFSMGTWVAAYISNEIHEDIEWLQVASRFLLLATVYNISICWMLSGLFSVQACILVQAFFSISFSHPLLSQMSLRRKEPRALKTMGQALGIPDSGLLSSAVTMSDIDINEPLEKLLLNKKFRLSFMTFADSCLAGESVHFYNEVYELGKIPMEDTVRRVYMARHIIERYIVNGSEMEVNISHRTRQEILGTSDLAHPDLFNAAVGELLLLMKMNLARDYWSSIFYLKFKEESQMKSQELVERLAGWDYSPRMSSVRGSDDPFHEEHQNKSSNQKHSNDSTNWT